MTVSEFTQIAAAVRFHRKRAGLTRAALARLAGVGKTVVFDIEHGKATVRFATLLGVLAARFPGKKLQWDAANLQVTNLPEANQYVRLKYRKGWEVKGL